jgi:hypothetical protein
VGHIGHILCIIFHATSQLLGTGGSGLLIKLSELLELVLVDTLHLHADAVFDLCFHAFRAIVSLSSISEITRYRSPVVSLRTGSELDRGLFRIVTVALKWPEALIVASPHRRDPRVARDGACFVCADDRGDVRFVPREHAMAGDAIIDRHWHALVPLPDR